MTSGQGGRPFQVLAGVRVVELTHMVAGPACGQILADLGAEVTKIEPPAGDVTRTIGPPLPGKSAADSALFASANRGKRSVFLDIREPAGAESARELVAQAQVVICNIDAGMVRRAGLDAETLRAARPELVYLDVTGFGRGQSGGTDSLAQAAMGLMSVTGAPEGPSFRTGATIVDVSAGVWGALAVISALLRQRETGEGAHIEESLGDICLYLQMPQLAMHVADPAVVRRNGNHSMISCTPLMSASDGRVMVTILHERHWGALCELTGVDDSVRRDPRFENPTKRSAHQGDIEEVFAPLFARRPRAEWVSLLVAAGLPCALERVYDEVIADERLHASGMLQRHGESLQVGLPLIIGGERVGAPAEVPAAPVRAPKLKGG